MFLYVILMGVVFPGRAITHVKKVAPSLFGNMKQVKDTVSPGQSISVLVVFSSDIDRLTVADDSKNTWLSISNV